MQRPEIAILKRQKTAGAVGYPNVYPEQRAAEVIKGRSLEFLSLFTRMSTEYGVKFEGSNPSDRSETERDR